MTDATIEESVLSPARLGAAAGVLSFGALAYVTILLFDRPAAALLVGALAGAGSYFLVPYSVRREHGGYERDAPRNLDRGFHPGAAGSALASSGMLALAFLFVDESALAVPAALALALAVIAYAVLSRVLPRAGEA